MNCVWCAGTKERLNTKTMKWGECLKHPYKKKVVEVEVLDLEKKYADRVRVGKTKRDHARRHKETA